nr:hypothetical protein [Tanacetum cinerariifolium]
HAKLIAEKNLAPSTRWLAPSGLASWLPASAKGKNKWNNPESTNARRNHHRLTNNKPELFGDNELPRPADLHRIAKSQRSSNSTASSGSNSQMFQEMIQQQYKLDRK